MRIRKRGLERAVSEGRKRRVLIQLGDEPLVVAGGKSFLNDALKTVGAVNLYDDLDKGYPRPSLEDVFRRNPDVIVVMAMGDDPGPFRRMAARWKGWPGLSAVRGDRVKVLRGDAVLRPSIRILEGLSLLERAVHGSGG